MKTTIFISSVQKELAAERRALKDYIQGDLRTPPVLTEASRPGRASDGRLGAERVLAAPRRRNAPVWPTGRQPECCRASGSRIDLAHPVLTRHGNPAMFLSGLGHYWKPTLPGDKPCWTR
jgi:hypothetical protein